MTPTDKILRGFVCWLCLHYQPTSTFELSQSLRRRTMGLPNPGMTIEPDRTALVITDLQNDFLTPGGNGWSLLADSYSRLDTVANLERLVKAARESGLTVLISPHYYYPTDHHWRAPGSATEVLMDQI